MIARSSLTLLLLCMLAACASSPTVNLHSLLPLSEPAAERDAGPRPRIVIASTVVPESVDRPQLLVALGGHEMRLLENERWSEPLKRAIPRALAHHLAQDVPAIVWGSSPAAPQVAGGPPKHNDRFCERRHRQCNRKMHECRARGLGRDRRRRLTLR